MSANDLHWDPVAQTLRPGLATPADVQGVLKKEMSREEIVALMEAAHHTLQEKFPMLKGTGFIVIDPRNPRFDGEEFSSLEDAKAAGSNVAYQSGTAIIYAPVLVQRPRRDVAESTPAPLLKQLGLPEGAQIALPSAAKPTE